MGNYISIDGFFRKSGFGFWFITQRGAKETQKATVPNKTHALARLNVTLNYIDKNHHPFWQPTYKGWVEKRLEKPFRW